LSVCAKCGSGPVTRLVSSPAIQFKGSGWYITDYARKSVSDPASSTEGKEKDGKDKKDGEKPAASATDTAKESKPSSEGPAAGSSKD
jgi:hypothetical protein